MMKIRKYKNEAIVFKAEVLQLQETRIRLLAEEKHSEALQSKIAAQRGELKTLEQVIARDTKLLEQLSDAKKEYESIKIEIRKEEEHRIGLSQRRMALVTAHDKMRSTLAQMQAAIPIAQERAIEAANERDLLMEQVKEAKHNLQNLRREENLHFKRNTELKSKLETIRVEIAMEEGRREEKKRSASEETRSQQNILDQLKEKIRNTKRELRKLEVDRSTATEHAEEAKLRAESMSKIAENQAKVAHQLTDKVKSLRRSWRAQVASSSPSSSPPSTKDAGAAAAASSSLSSSSSSPPPTSTTSFDMLSRRLEKKIEHEIRSAMAENRTLFAAKDNSDKSKGGGRGGGSKEDSAEKKSEEEKEEDGHNDSKQGRRSSGKKGGNRITDSSKSRDEDEDMMIKNSNGHSKICEEEDATTSTAARNASQEEGGGKKEHVDRKLLQVDYHDKDHSNSNILEEKHQLEYEVKRLQDLVKEESLNLDIIRRKRKATESETNASSVSSSSSTLLRQLQLHEQQWLHRLLKQRQGDAEKLADLSTRVVMKQAELRALEQNMSQKQDKLRTLEQNVLKKQVELRAALEDDTAAVLSESQKPQLRTPFENDSKDNKNNNDDGDEDIITVGVQAKHHHHHQQQQQQQQQQRLVHALTPNRLYDSSRNERMILVETKNDGGGSDDEDGGNDAANKPTTETVATGPADDEEGLIRRRPRTAHTHNDEPAELKRRERGQEQRQQDRMTNVFNGSSVKRILSVLHKLQKQKRGKDEYLNDEGQQRGGNHEDSSEELKGDEDEEQKKTQILLGITSHKLIARCMTVTDSIRTTFAAAVSADFNNRGGGGDKRGDKVPMTPPSMADKSNKRQRMRAFKELDLFAAECVWILREIGHYVRHRLRGNRQSKKGSQASGAYAKEREQDDSRWEDSTAYDTNYEEREISQASSEMTVLHSRFWLLAKAYKVDLIELQSVYRGREEVLIARVKNQAKEIKLLHDDVARFDAILGSTISRWRDTKVIEGNLLRESQNLQAKLEKMLHLRHVQMDLQQMRFAMKQRDQQIRYLARKATRLSTTIHTLHEVLGENILKSVSSP
eukprot:jgi/Bigna1/130654/aug1.12_g5362